MAASKVNTQQVVEKYVELGGNISATARALGVARGTVQHHLNKENITKPVAAGKKDGDIKETQAPLPESGVQRYILTCAQNNTKVHAKFWENLLAAAYYYDADIKVSRITYNMNAYTAQPQKPGKAQKQDRELWYDPAFADYISDERIELAPGLVWCGELNILPTAKRPLSDLESYTGRKSGIIPHVKVAMDSVASGKHEATKFNYTTGTATLMSYIQRKAGQKAEQHHSYGALLVEVDEKGRWFVRQLTADATGRFYDLDAKFEKGEVTEGNRVEAINWGDIHEDQLDETVRELAWIGEDCMMDTLKPKYQFMHDSLSFARRNHHEIKNPHKMFEKFVKGEESVEEEVVSLVRFLNEESFRPDCRTLVVNSNHDDALERWLREADYKKDPPNAIYFLKCQLRKYEAIAEQDDGFHIVEWCAQEAGCKAAIQWLREDESFVICRDKDGGIECGMHGHLGADGARGAPLGFTKMGRKANTGHTHKAGIIDGVYTAGTSSQLDLGYNRGPSSWSNSHIVTYANGKRAIITMWNGAWQAE